MMVQEEYERLTIDEQLRTVIQDNNQVWILKLINIFSLLISCISSNIV